MLEDINNPSDIKKLDIDQLQLLADEIKEFLIASIKKTGGHLGSNLGAIELTLALHYVFDILLDCLLGIILQCLLDVLVQYLLFALSKITIKDEINVPMALSVFRDEDRSPRSGGGWDLSKHC